MGQRLGSLACLEMTLPDPQFWRGRRVLLTGHTGFKGSWLSLWLHRMGAKVHGLSLAPATDPSLFEVARVETALASSTIGDISDFQTVSATMQSAQPEVVLHLAAQPLVRLSYAEPVKTYATNVMGTVHVCEAARHTGSVRAIVCVTTDKCYENFEWPWAYRETDHMGGHDPYSSSKGCAELVASAYRRSFMADAGIGLATGRAGNVIGGGDWAADRLVPDALRAYANGQPLTVRYPKAVRPWQHVLEPLAGYLMLAERLAAGDPTAAEAWNFGPAENDARPVDWIVEALAQEWGDGASWSASSALKLHEAGYLRLDVAKARQRLGWTPRWNLTRALRGIVGWHRQWLQGDDMQAACLVQIDEYNRPTMEVF